jgi:hypothetical protein
MDERALLLAILLVLEEIAEELVPFAPSIVSGTVTFQGGSMSDITVPDSTTTLTATVAYQDSAGDPTSPQSVPAWSSSDDSIASVDASADPTGLTAAVTVHGALGSATISAAETNTDGTVVTGSGTITVEAGAPATGDVSFAQ